MGARSRFTPYLQLLLVLVPVVLLLTGCSTNNPYNTLTDRGDVSITIRRLFWPVLWVAIFVFFAVEGLLLYTVLRYREHPGRDDQLPKQTHGNTRLEVGWTILPALILAGISIPTVSTIVSLSSKPDNAITVKVTGFQWWWQFQYDYNGQTVYTANELHVPVGRKIYAQITSNDVIHSFFVPNLAGKQDAVPNHVNDLSFVANAPGVYAGECAEYCLTSHALMRFIVIAEPEDQFNAWLANQARPANDVTGSAARGRELFLGNACIACHAIQGTAAQARVAPNLTHFGTRSSLGANRLENTPENVQRWIRNPGLVKPGAKMPAFSKDYGGQLENSDIAAIADYLESLK